ncbi:hypothetical protein A1O3_03813 [Capronia epimyces CBS 606.96]|uniref:Choline transport protein n=1 Tax=Capronia epimyces CBS 606.96 TaxID=1182542 RepID=W9YX59_9EURO|nr:uncharacterized protein A1O3_03813 [Capronia epimyces CBS 606.96]EXJ86859.1 hypothetical protein A1O3_03813 [Capronia epimyces CBS 606.96]
MHPQLLADAGVDYGTIKTAHSASRSVDRDDQEAQAQAQGHAGLNLDLDDAELEASGYHRELPRQFSMLSLMAMAYALLCTWNGFGSAFGASLKQASSAGSIFTLLPAALFIGVVSLGMAELTSAFPVAGGQYYWTYLVSRAKWAPIASYFTAMISVIGCWLGGAATCNFIAGMILSIAEFTVPDFQIEAWHKYVVYVTVIWAAVAINVLASQGLPALNKFIFYFSLITFMVTMTVMLACSYPHYRSARDVFTDDTVHSGWHNRGLAWTLCFVNSLYGFLGTDAGVHMVEEMPDPSVNGPKVILYPIILGLATVLPFASVCMFVVKDMDEVLHSPSGLPLIQLYYQATDSQAGTVALMVAFTVCFFACAAANVTGSSRQVWSAARDECFPRSDLWKKIDPTYQMPLNAVLLQGCFGTIYGLLFFGSPTAFASMVSASIIFIVGSYVVPQTMLLFRPKSRAQLLPARAFDLGRWGYPVNLVSTVCTAFLLVACCIPTEYPITVANMNYNR